VVACAHGLDPSLYEALTRGYPNVSAVTGKTYALLQQSTAALVTSGTATLETALLGVPQVVCYKGSTISYQIAKRLVKVQYISLVNLILQKQAVQELIQHDLTKSNLITALEAILPGGSRREQQIADYAKLKAMLQQETAASDLAADSIIGIFQ